MTRRKDLSEEEQLASLVERMQMAAAAAPSADLAATPLEELLALDPTCPYCGGGSNVTDVYDGSERHCYQCKRLLVAVEYIDGSMRLVGREPEALTGRKRTRALWRRRGRR